MKRMMRVTPVLMLSLTSLCLSGCRYASNRASDFADIFQIGGGLTAENPFTGMVPPSLGLHVQATEFLNLGAIHFSGVTAEMDGRGFFAGPESRTRLGFGPWQKLKIDQEYDQGSENYFKKLETLWNDRMNAPAMRWHNRPAKDLNYEFWSFSMREATPALARGWQYWENIGIEAGICEPFLTHFGVNLKLGFDPSEISDFLLGWAHVDFKHDDLTEDEYKEMTGDSRVVRDFKPGVPDPDAPAATAPTEAK